MSTPTGFDVHIPGSTLKTMGPVLLAMVVGASSGGGATALGDLTGARAYKESLAEKVSHVEDLQRDLHALRAQNEQLMMLLQDGICQDWEE